MAKQTFTTGQVLTAAQMTSLQQTAMGGGSATAKTASYVLVAADAGTTVAMNAAGSTTITVNTGLFAAGDTVFIQNLGAGACTVTAGTATVATAGSLILPQNDAGILYFTATGASIFYDYIQAGAVSPLTTKGDLYTFSTSDARLAVGANDTTLVADSSEATGLKWATPSSAAISWTLLHIGVSLTGSSTSFTGLSGYNYLKVLVRVMRSSTSTNTFSATFNTDTSGKYYFFGVKNRTQSSFDVDLIGTQSTQGDTKLELIQRGSSASSEVDGALNIVGANSTSHKMYDFSFGSTAGTGANAGNKIQGGFYQGTSVISSIELFLSSGTFSQGTATIYGGN